MPFNYTATYTDLYQLTMAQVYFKNNRGAEKAVFDYYFRKNPFGGGYTIFAGLQDLLEILKNLKFSKADLTFLEKEHFDKDFLKYLEDFEFDGDIYSTPEGDVVFPHRPILRVEASLIDAQLIETVLLNTLNFQSLIATKARRIRWIANNKTLIDFGLRRAQGTGGYAATRAAFIGGFNGTSNVISGLEYDIPVSGTMAHSFIQSYDDELSAFRAFAENRPEKCVLLVDTYNTLKSGVPNAITVAKEMEQRGHKLMGIRLDSGDLAYFSRKSRKMLDDAGLGYVQIAASNQLDERVIKSLQEQNARIDIYGVGTSLVIGRPDAALDGVYKLAYYDDEPRIKLSENILKITLPHAKQVFRVKDKNGTWIGADAIGMASQTRVEHMYHPHQPLKNMNLEDLPQEPILQPVMKNGKILIPLKTLEEIRAYSLERFAQLPEEHKRFDNPHQYKVGISTALKDERDNLMKHYKRRP